MKLIQYILKEEKDSNDTEDITIGQNHSQNIHEHNNETNKTNELYLDLNSTNDEYKKIMTRIIEMNKDDKKCDLAEITRLRKRIAELEEYIVYLETIKYNKKVSDNSKYAHGRFYNKKINKRHQNEKQKRTK